MRKAALAMLWLVLRAGCSGAFRGDANAGPNPGGAAGSFVGLARRSPQEAPIGL
jgi:hypothetical protein